MPKKKSTIDAERSPLIILHENGRMPLAPARFALIKKCLNWPLDHGFRYGLTELK